MLIRNFLRTWTLLFCISAVMPAAWAQDSAPKEMLRQVTNTMISRLTSERARVKSDPEYVFKLVDEILVPKADFREMAKRVLATHWRGASEAQRIAFTKEFQTLVIRTYATAFRRYKDEQVEIIGERYGRGNKDLVEINTTIKQTEGHDIPVNYRMIKRENGWKVYDMNVDGVSLISSLKSQFSDKLRNEGIDSVTSDLKRKNENEKKKLVSNKG